MNFVKGSWHLHFILVIIGVCAVRTFEIIKLPIGLNIALRSYNLIFFQCCLETKIWAANEADKFARAMPISLYSFHGFD